MNTKHLHLPLALLLLAGAQAQDVPAPWSQVFFSATHEQTEAKVTIEGLEALTKVQLSLAGAKMLIPAAELEGIKSPRLHTAQLLFGSDYYGPLTEDEEPIPHQIIEMDFGKESKFGGYQQVRFIFYSGAYQFRTEATRSSPKLWIQTMKYPGEKPIESGTISRPNPDPEPVTESSGKPDPAE